MSFIAVFITVVNEPHYWIQLSHFAIAWPSAS